MKGARERVRTDHQFIVMGIYSLIALVPQTIGARPDSHVSGGWTWWPFVLMVIAVSLGLATDRRHRRIVTRVLLIAVCVLAYFLVTWPLVRLAAEVLTPIARPDAPNPEFGWAMIRISATFPQLVFAMRSSRLMELWAERPNLNMRL